mmetsp:Transcript_58321/g.115596  ORF Transcript_58321/g.115596 Transcript_58321/m.115596 type:complete len:259 (-) Transcript_58321:1063-1839(-)
MCLRLTCCEVSLRGGTGAEAMPPGGDLHGSTKMPVSDSALSPLNIFRRTSCSMASIADVAATRRWPSPLNVDSSWECLRTSTSKIARRGLHSTASKRSARTPSSILSCRSLSVNCTSMPSALASNAAAWSANSPRTSPRNSSHKARIREMNSILSCASNSPMQRDTPPSTACWKSSPITAAHRASTSSTRAMIAIALLSTSLDDARAASCSTFSMRIMRWSSCPLSERSDMEEAPAEGRDRTAASSISRRVSRAGLSI